MSPSDKNYQSGPSNQDDDDEPEVKFYEVQKKDQNVDQSMPKPVARNPQHDQAIVISASNAAIDFQPTSGKTELPRPGEPARQDEVGRELQAFGFHRDVKDPNLPVAAVAPESLTSEVPRPAGMPESKAADPVPAQVAQPTESVSVEQGPQPAEIATPEEVAQSTASVPVEEVPAPPAELLQQEDSQPSEGVQTEEVRQLAESVQRGVHSELSSDSGSSDTSRTKPSPATKEAPLSTVRVAHQYWVVEQARSVTHGIFSDFVPSAVTGREQEFIAGESAPNAVPVLDKTFKEAQAETLAERETSKETSTDEEPTSGSEEEPVAQTEVVKSEIVDSKKALVPSAEVLNFEPTPTRSSETAELLAGETDPEFGWVPADASVEKQKQEEAAAYAPTVLVTEEKKFVGPIKPADVDAVGATLEVPTKSPSTAEVPTESPGGDDEAEKSLFKRHLKAIVVLLLGGIAGGAIIYNVFNSSIAPVPESRSVVVQEKPAKVEEKGEPPVELKQTEEKLRLTQLRLGLKYEKEKDWDAALEQFNIVLSEPKPSAEALHARGRVLTKMQKYALAKDDLERASELSEKDQSILIDLAAVKFLLNDYAGAVKEYDRLAALEHNNIDAFYGRGISYAAMGKQEEAIADLQQVVRLKPTYGEAYRQMSSVYMAGGQNDKAEGVITLGIKYNGTNEDLYFCRALARYKQGRKEEAIEDYGKAIELNPGRKEFLNDRGYVLMELGKFEEAKHDFEKSLQIDPTYKLAEQNLKTATEELDKKSQK